MHIYKIYTLATILVISLDVCKQTECLYYSNLSSPYDLKSLMLWTFHQQENSLAH